MAFHLIKLIFLLTSLCLQPEKQVNKDIQEAVGTIQSRDIASKFKLKKKNVLELSNEGNGTNMMVHSTISQAS